MSKEIPQMRTITETAEIMHLPVHFIRFLCKTGQIHFVQAGKKKLVNVDRFIDYLNNPPSQEIKDEVEGIRRIEK